MKAFDLADVLRVPELPTYLEQVEAELKRAISADDPLIGPALRRLMQAKGKRLRPALVFAVATALGATIDKKTVAAATSIELIHISSLIHDDIIDHADTRWNIPTINVREGVDQALLAGDYIFARGCAVAASVDANAAQTVAAAFSAICQGQAMELADLHNLERGETSLHRAVQGKTSAMLIASCQLGGLRAGTSPAQLQALVEFGENMGMSFQYVDDILNFLADPRLLGKPIGNDIIEGNYNLPVILALQTPYRDAVKTAIKNNQIDELMELLVQSGAMQATIQRAQTYNDIAAQSLKSFDQNPATKALQDFPNTYMNWALSQQTAINYRNIV
jgi:geranylgeranyl pyrophosphate synthase